MISSIRDWLYIVQIRLLILLNPPRLFEKINQLDWYKEILHSWIEVQGLKPNSQVLEIGSATGELSLYLAQKSYKPMGVDGSKNMINLAKSKYKHLDFQVANVYDLPFEKNSFDAVVASSLINVLDDKDKALKEMIRVCSKDGIVTFLVPLKGFTDNDLKKLSKKLELSHFSKAALKMWHKSAKKMCMEEIKELLNVSKVEAYTTREYLNGMVISISFNKQP